MAQRLEGNAAKYEPTDVNPQTTWVYGDEKNKPTPILTSDSFGSCVGLVLYKAFPRAGAVAHFPGSLGHSTNLGTADSDAREILQGVIGNPGNQAGRGWNAWVFGGSSLQSGSPNDSSVKGNTMQLIDHVRQALATYGGIVENKDTKGGYVGHVCVRLVIASGTVQLGDGTASEKLNLVRRDSNPAKAKPAWKVSEAPHS